MKAWAGIAATALGASLAGDAQCADVSRTVFGSMPDGSKVEAVTLSNTQGIEVRVISFGATLQSLVLPDRNGRFDDVVLGYDALGDYVERPQFFGSTVGRYANRIAGARFQLDDASWHLAANNGANALHGGNVGFDKLLWSVEEIQSGPAASVELSHVSQDGDEGYPGTLQIRVRYTLHDTGTLEIRFEATTDKATVVNLTNHSYFNLAGVLSGRSALEQLLQIDADYFTPVDASLIPTGELRSVAGSAFDFRSKRSVGLRIRETSDAQLAIGRGYDHNFVIRGGVTQTPKRAARLEDPASGRVMELWTTEPGLQLYSANHLNGTVTGKGGLAMRQSDAIALEPQKFPDAPNQPAFPSARLNPGEVYRHVSRYRFFTESPRP